MLIAIEALGEEDSFRQAMREFGDQDKRLYRAARTRWQAAINRRKTTAKAAYVGRYRNESAPAK